MQVGTFESASIINPHNIGFFIDLILNNDFVADNLKPKLAKSFYDMALIIAFKYHQVEDFMISLDLFRLATRVLKTHVSQYLQQLRGLRYPNGKVILLNLFGNPYLKEFFDQDHFDVFLTEGGKEILTTLRELQVL